MSEYVGEFEDDQIEITGVRSLGDLSFTPPAGVAEAGAWQMAITVEGKPGTDAAGPLGHRLLRLHPAPRRRSDRGRDDTRRRGAVLLELRDELISAAAGRM